VTQRPPGPPAPDQVVELLSGEFAQAGYEIEAVEVDAAARPPRLRVVADGDTPLDLETIAALSRAASALLDTLHTGPGGYVLEVSSPGVDRPLTTEKHFRRARGRRVEVGLTDGTTVSGRVRSASAGAVELLVGEESGWSVRAVPIAQISSGAVQVEFSAPSSAEIEALAAGGPDSRKGRESER
jgi:ribosome maturation factor RimP